MSRYVSLTINLDGALDAARRLSDVPKRILSAQARALSTLGRRLPVEARRDIQAEYKLTATRINRGLRLRRPGDGLVLVGSARGINAIEFGATWSRRMPGARFAIKLGDARTAHDGSFIATGRSGNRLVFERAGKKRLPIQGVYGPSIGQMLKHGRRPERLAEFAIRTLEAEQARILKAGI